MKKHGRCALTGDEGKFVKSHIIPQSVTRFEIKGARVMQLGIGYRAGWRPTSWYDDELVTQKGEDILQLLDDNGVLELKDKRMIWNSWNKDWERIPEEYLAIPGTYDINFRVIKNIDVQALRLFFLSLVWRAAVSNRIEMREVELEQEVIDLLAGIIKGEIADEPHFFTITFDQIITKGPLHNRTPIMDEDQFDVDENTKLHRKFVRFYFNGLVTNVHLSTDKSFFQHFGKLALGFEDEILCICRSFEKSRELSDIKEMISHS
jgi:hypothetical protein